MKLLFVCHMFPHALDDTIRAIRYLGMELIRRGHEVDYFYRRGQEPQPVSMLEWPMRIAPLASRKCRQKQYDIILATESSGWALSSFRDWLLPKHTRIVSWRSESTPLTSVEPAADGSASLELQPDARQTLIQQLNGWTVEQSLKTQDGCFLTALDEMHRLRARYPQFAGKVLYQPRGVAPQFYSPERLNQKLNHPAERLLYVGTRQAGQATGEILSAAFQRIRETHPRVTLTVAGFDSSQTRELLASFPQETQAALNPVTLEEEKILPDLYLRHDVLIQPRNTQGLPLAVLEAMASAMPAVVALDPDYPEVLTHYESGLLVPPNDTNALAESVSHLLENPQLCRELGEAAFETVSRCYTWHQACDLFEANLTRIFEQPI